MRRVLRIFPVYYLTLVFLLFILSVFDRIPYDIHYYRTYQYWFYFFFQNWLFILKPLEAKFLLNHFWSLAIEEQFYLLWPLIIFLAAKTKRLFYTTAGLFLFVFLARLILLYAHIMNQHAPAFTFLRFDGLLIGCTLAIFTSYGFILTRKLLRFIFIPLAMINAAFFLAVFMLKKNLLYFPCIGYTTFSLLFGLIVHYVIHKRNSSQKKEPDYGPLQFFGKISYGLYIYHWPVFILLFPLIQATFLTSLKLPASISYVLAAGATTTVAILLSMISHKYFERFFLALKKKFV